MNITTHKSILASAAIAGLLAAGCGRQHENDGGHGRGHGDDAQSFSGATHTVGAGITLLAPTHRALNIETAEVNERSLPREVRFTATTHRPAGPAAGLFATGHIAPDRRPLLAEGILVQVSTEDGRILPGTATIHAIRQPVAADDDEVVIRLADPPDDLRPGTFLHVVARAPGQESLPVIPRDAVIRAADSNFVFVVNGSAYLRTPVDLGDEADGLVAVRDGLLAGDSVVARGAMDLWLIELRAVKGGQGCCPAPPAKRRN